MENHKKFVLVNCVAKFHPKLLNSILSWIAKYISLISYLCVAGARIMHTFKTLTLVLADNKVFDSYV